MQCAVPSLGFLQITTNSHCQGLGQTPERDVPETGTTWLHQDRRRGSHPSTQPTQATPPPTQGANKTNGQNSSGLVVTPQMLQHRDSVEGRRVQEAAPNPANDPPKVQPLMGQKGLTQVGPVGKGRDCFSGRQASTMVVTC